ncbi:hypothetical protein CSUI_004667, partial [Cystoisospora suis]
CAVPADNEANDPAASLLAGSLKERISRRQKRRNCVYLYMALAFL